MRAVVVAAWDAMALYNKWRRGRLTGEVVCPVFEMGDVLAKALEAAGYEGCGKMRTIVLESEGEENG